MPYRQLKEYLPCSVHTMKSLGSLRKPCSPEESSECRAQCAHSWHEGKVLKDNLRAAPASPASAPCLFLAYGWVPSTFPPPISELYE